ncbi:MAG: DUF177 domain-containing protein [Candidatus Omnitrophica bacterium]|nr:DUF177 domain-containing protein [Candidatus Omnitrophota bacterium]
MKINIDQIPAEGFILEETIGPQVLDLDTEIVKFPSPVKVKARVFKITDTVSVDLTVNTVERLVCSRCINEYDHDYAKDFKLDYQVDKKTHTLDLDPDIREEIVIDFPIKPLCKADCRGLCPNCGKNLNEGNCGCGSSH